MQLPFKSGNAQGENRKSLPEIDGLRAFAILYVLLLHLYGFVEKKMPAVFTGKGTGYPLLRAFFLNGGFGVQVFFVLSGFLIFRGFLQKQQRGEKMSLRPYFRRRFTRIEPPYVVALLLNFGLLILLAPEAARVAREQLPHLFSSLFYVHNIVFPRHADSLNIGVWSLEVEIQFYLLAPLLLLPLLRLSHPRRIATLAGLYAVFAGLNLLWQPPFTTLYSWLPYFLAGVGLAVFVPDDLPEPTRKAGPLLLGLLLFAFMLCWLVVAPQLSRTVLHLFNKALHPIIIAAFCYTVFRSGFLRRAFTWGIFPFLGHICYSIYLVHYPLISFFGNHVRALQVGNSYLLTLGAQMLLTLVPVLLGCAVFYVLVEKPFRLRR